MGSICGFLGAAPGEVVQDMLRLLEHRGPGDSGTHVETDLALGYNHLQPPPANYSSRVGTSVDGRVVCVMDGYLFNGDELAQRLAAHGIRPATAEPAELVANWFQQFGEEEFRQLDGAFAVALNTPRGLFLARDALGEKPVYYTNTPSGDLLFASEVKAFLACEQFACEPNVDALNRLLVFSFAPGEETMFAGVRQLLPGCYLHANGRPEPRQVPYWDLEENVNEADDEGVFVERMAELLSGAVKKRLRGEPVGALLSGGLDSSAVVALLWDLGVDLTTFTVGFGHGLQNELMYAKLVAEHCHTRHHVLHVQPKMFIELLPQIIWNLDDPLCDCIVVPNYLLAREAANEVGLLFNGEGGDPLFGGPKNKFLILNEWYKHLGGVDTTRAYLSSYHKWYDHLEELYTPDFLQQTGGAQSLEEFIRPYVEHGRQESFLNTLMYLNTKFKGGQNILVKVDKMFSARSLPVMSPLFDRQLAEFSFTVPPRLKRRGDVEKYVFKRAMEDKLPGPVVYRKKAGMGVPLNHWFRRTELKEYAYDVLTSQQALERGYFDERCVRRLLKGKMPRNAFGQDRSGELLWMLLAVELWHQVFVDGRGLEQCARMALKAS